MTPLLKNHQAILRRLFGGMNVVFFRFMADAFVCTTQLERIVRGVRTFITTPPGGLEDKTPTPSAGVNETFYLCVDMKHEPGANTV